MRSQYTESQADLGHFVKPNTAPGTNTRVFGILLILMQIAISLIYGFLVWLPPVEPADVGLVNFSPIIITVILFFMVVLGFGALFAYERKLVWSALGFNLLIVCLTIQWFFLIYLFWFKTNIRQQGIGFRSGIDYNNIWLTNGIQKAVTSTLTVTAAGGCLTQAIKCSLANCIGFSGILGRAGPLEAFFLALFGTIGFQLNRAICEYLYFDYGGTYTVFTYGGFMSLIVGLLLRFKETGVRTTEKHPKYSGRLFTGALSIFGASMLFAIFPIITADPELPWTENGTQIPIKSQSNITSYFNVPLSIWYSMSSSLIIGTAFSTFVYQKVVLRDFVNSVVAGGVAACSAGYYFTNPVWAMVLGSTCGIVQSLVQGLIEKRIAMNSRIFNTYSWTLFGIQGIIGGIFASIFRRVVEYRNDNIVYDFTTNNKNPGYDLAIALVSAAFGIAFGLLIGIMILITARHEKQDHFDDYTYWVPDDGIRYPRSDRPTPLPVPIPQPLPDTQIYVKETNINVKAKHAYL